MRQGGMPHGGGSKQLRPGYGKRWESDQDGERLHFQAVENQQRLLHSTCQRNTIPVLAAMWSIQRVSAAWEQEHGILSQPRRHL
jgi:hypothetical protein